MSSVVTDRQLTVAEARELTVSDQETADKAGTYVSALAGLRKAISDHFAPMKSAAHEAHKAVVAAEKQQLAPIEEATKQLKAKIAEWTAEERRKAEAERRRLEEERAARQREAEKKAREEQAKRDEEARKERMRLEAEAEAERQRKQAEEDARAAAEKREAARIEAAAVEIPVAESVAAPEPEPELPIAAPVTPRAAGVRTSVHWGAEIDNAVAFAAWCVENKRCDLLTVNEPALRAMAREVKGETEAPAGIRWTKEERVSAR